MAHGRMNKLFRQRFVDDTVLIAIASRAESQEMLVAFHIDADRTHLHVTR